MSTQTFSGKPLPTQPFNLYVRAVTVPGLDTDLSVYVAFQDVRYLFGCGEGTQRAFIEKKLSTLRIAGVFLPDGGSKGRAGLPGYVMTAADAGVDKLDIIGPSDTTRYVATLRTSMARGDINVNIHNHPHDSSTHEARDTFEGPSLYVQSIALRPSAIVDASDRSADMREDGERIARDHVSSMFPGKLGPEGERAPAPYIFQNAPSRDETATQMVYICKTPTVPGHFNNQKAVELGVPNGRIRRDLIEGKSIQFDDPANPGQKKTVRPEEVVGAAAPGPIFIMVNSSSSTLPELLETKALDEYRASPNEEPSVSVAVIIHRVPKAVWQDERYHDWIKSFGSKTQHLIASTDGYKNDVLFGTTAWSLLRLSLLDGTTFPALPFTSPDSNQTIDLPPNTTFLVPGHKINLQPAGELEIIPPQGKDIPYPTTLDEAQTARRKCLEDMPEFAMECAKSRASVQADPRYGKPYTVPGDDITVTTLGTGSALPSKYRNVSSTYLDIPNWGGLLLDCGEGTLGQMRRRYGRDGMKKLYSDLKIIFISHMHADHQLGLQRILEDRFKLGITSKLYILGPNFVAIMLAESGAWSSAADSSALDNIVFIDNAMLESGHLPGVAPNTNDQLSTRMEAALGCSTVSESRSYPLLCPWPRYNLFSAISRHKFSLEQMEIMKEELGLSGIRAPRVVHRGQAWGLAIQHPSGWKIVYSGDTKPSPRLIEAGQGATLLIHEATLGDDEPELASHKGHSTFSQAVQVGVKMDAKRILLNHFSQRYPKMPNSRASVDDKRDISISYDFMTVKVGDLWKMKYYMKAAELLFTAEENEGVEVEEAVSAEPGPPKLSRRKAKAKEYQEKKAAKRAASPNGDAQEAKRTRSDEEVTTAL